jgi:hypothetical protein
MMNKVYRKTFTATAASYGLKEATKRKSIEQDLLYTLRDRMSQSRLSTRVSVPVAPEIGLPPEKNAVRLN